MGLTRTMVCWSKHATHRRTPSVARMMMILVHLLKQTSDHVIHSVH